MAVGIVATLLILAFVFIGLPMLCRAIFTRLSGSAGFKQWLAAYGPRFGRFGQNEPDDGTE
jgi:hypothetical protein